MTLQLTEVTGEVYFGISMQMYLNMLLLIARISNERFFALNRVLLHKIWCINGYNYKAI